MSNPPQRTSDDAAAREASVARDSLMPRRPRRAAQLGWVASAALAALVEWWIVQPRYPFFVAPASPVAPSAPSGPGAHQPNDIEIAVAARLASMNIAALVGLAGATIGAALSLAHALPGASVKRASPKSCSTASTAIRRLARLSTAARCAFLASGAARPDPRPCASHARDGCR